MTLRASLALAPYKYHTLLPYKMANVPATGLPSYSAIYSRTWSGPSASYSFWKYSSDRTTNSSRVPVTTIMS